MDTKIAIQETVNASIRVLCQHPKFELGKIDGALASQIKSIDWADIEFDQRKKEIMMVIERYQRAKAPRKRRTNHSTDPAKKLKTKPLPIPFVIKVEPSDTNAQEYKEEKEDSPAPPPPPKFKKGDLFNGKHEILASNYVSQFS